MVTEMAGDFRLPRNDRLNNWQLGDTLFLTRGAHAAKFGFQVQYLQFDQDTTSQQGGIVTFPNLATFLQGQPSSVDFAVPGLIDPTAQLPAVAVRVLRAGRPPARDRT